ncbi:MAG TPA: EAL domain-containing protein [Gammaproteobacteria bacterium]
MTRKISVLFVGTSAARGSAALHVLAAHGYEVSLDMPFVGQCMAQQRNFTGQFEEHDLIAFDANGAGSCGVLLFDSRAGTRTGRGVHVNTVDALPEAVVELLGNGTGTADTERGTQAGELDELREIVAGLPGVVFRCGLAPRGRVDFLGEQVMELCGMSRSHFVGHGSERLLALVHPGDRRRVLTALQRSMRSAEPFALEHRIVCHGGREKWLWHRGCVRDTGDSPQLESFVVDITERKRDEQQLAYLANHDALTGVANRSSFMEQAGKSIRRADRHGEMIACLFLDLDRFKRINDSFGHDAGDELLRQVSERLKRCIRGNDMIGRFGGDEFTVLLDGIARTGDAATVAEKILDELLRPYDIHGRHFTISASIGISCYPGDATDKTALLKNADAAMYSVKSTGRRGYRFYSPEMANQAFATLALANGLRAAIESNGLHLSWQPRVNLRTGRVSGLEVLARWESEEFGPVSPERFITLAEDTGLIEPLGNWVLATACRQAMAWDREDLPRVRISINLSPRQFHDERLAGQVAAALEETGLPPWRLEFEIAESTLMQDHAAATDALRRLKKLGVALSIDDFGTGYSSLNLLKKFPLDYLKIDQSFIAGVPDDPDDVAVTEAIIAMARRLNLGVVAEGIESEAQGIFVRSSGCREGQGHLFSRPVDDSGIRKYLQQRVH